MKTRHLLFFAVAGLVAGPPAQAADVMSGLWAWFELPLQGVRAQEPSFKVVWHGRLMVLGWGLFIPLGVLVARFLKVTPRQEWPYELDNQLWWHGHRLFQWGGVAAMTLGAVLIWGGRSSATGTGAAAVHAWLGWFVLMLGWMQIASGLLRGTKGGPVDERSHEVTASSEWRGDHYDMTPRRRVFEYVHKTLGYAALAIAVAVLLMGLWIAQAPRWMWLVLTAWGAVWGLAFSVLQRGGWCIDTYQAIWGTGRMHPGNDIRPIGWGVTRHTRISIRRRSVGNCQPGRVLPDRRKRTQQRMT